MTSTNESSNRKAGQRPPHWRRGAFRTVWLITAFFLVAEIVGNVSYYIDHGQFLYDLEGRRDATIEAGAAAVPGRTIFHPIFGYINIHTKEALDSYGMYQDSRGFLSSLKYYKENPGCCDFPAPAKTNEIWIGIFGNSIATGLAMIEQLNGTLSSKLENSSRFSGKKIIIANFSIGGGNYAQSVAVMNYLYMIGQHIDIAVFSDSLVEYEASLGNWTRNEDQTFPQTYLHMVDRIEATGKSSATHLEQLAIRALIQDSENAASLCQLGLCYLRYQAEKLFLEFRQGFLDDEPDCSIKKPDATTGNNCAPLIQFARSGPAHPSTDDPWLGVTDSWNKAIINMNALAQANGSRFIYLMMPNPWLRKGKDYRVEVPSSPVQIKEQVNLYETMQNRFPNIKKVGAEVVDAAHVLDESPISEVYSSDDMHLANRGYAEVLEHLAEYIQTHTRPKPVSP